MIEIANPMARIMASTTQGNMNHLFLWKSKIAYNEFIDGMDFPEVNPVRRKRIINLPLLPPQWAGAKLAPSSPDLYS